MGWLAVKVKFVTMEGRRVLEDPSADGLEKQEVMMDLVRAAGAVIERRDRAGLLLVGEILALLPLARKYAEGLFREKLDKLQEILLEIRIMAAKKIPSP